MTLFGNFLFIHGVKKLDRDYIKDQESLVKKAKKCLSMDRDARLTIVYFISGLRRF